MKGDGMEWTQELPTKPGVYWVHGDEWVNIVRVDPPYYSTESWDRYASVERFGTGDSYELRYLKQEEWWWYGPMERPEPPAGIA